MNNEIVKTVIINRAVPGSGKTTISNCIISYLTKKGFSVANHSTDEFFVNKDGRYVFDLKMLYSNHLSNLANFTKSLKSKCPVVLCDNINLCPWQTEPYTSVARQFGYQILFMNFYPRELEKHIQSQQVTTKKPDAHGVPEEVLVRFIRDFEDYNSLLDKSLPVDPSIHKHYKWDKESNMRVISDKECYHFDLDEVITILPHEYHDIRTEIGKIVYETISKNN
jgi:hypothetical protein